VVGITLPCKSDSTSSANILFLKTTVGCSNSEAVLCQNSSKNRYEGLIKTLTATRVGGYEGQGKHKHKNHN